MAEPQTPTTSTDTGQVSYADFAAKIRSKYPDSKLYKSKPDKELVDAWIQAKPERSVYVKKIKGFDPANEGGKGVPSGVPIHTGSKQAGNTTELLTAQQQKDRESKLKPLIDQTGAALPTAGGFVGGMLGGGKGPIAAGTAAIGGAVGKAMQDLEQRIVFDRNIDTKTALAHMGKEAAVQGALQFGGEKVGDAFFKLLNKVPHAVLKQGIKFLPSDLAPNGRVMKYVEDILSNLLPSAKTMEAFKAEQSAAIGKKLDSIIQGFAKFKGTSEEMGIAVQKTLAAGKEALQDKLDLLEKGYIKKGFSKSQAQRYVSQTALGKQMATEYENELIGKVIANGKLYNKPELIAGLLRSKEASNEETRILTKTLSGLDGETLGKVRNTLMQDIVNETITGSKDPVAKGAQNLTGKFSGNKFKDVLDGIGETKLKAIYGDVAYKNIEEFTKLVGTVGSPVGGFGKFINLTLALPFLHGVTAKSLMHATGTALIMNRAAKVITSTEGMRLYENIIRATAANAPRATKLAYDEYKTYINRQDEQFVREQKIVEDQYYKDHPDEVKYRDQNKQ